MKHDVAAKGISAGSTSTLADSHWPEILAAAEERDVRRSEFVRLILIEMSVVCRELRAVSEHSSLEFKIKPLLAQVHALRTLAETARYATELATEADVVNLDGPKFEYVLRQMYDLVRKCAQKADCAPLAIDNICTAFRHGLEDRQEEIRTNMEKVSADSNPANDSLWPKKPSNESADSSPGDTAAEHPTT